MQQQQQQQQHLSKSGAMKSNQSGKQQRQQQRSAAASAQTQHCQMQAPDCEGQQQQPNQQKCSKKSLKQPTGVLRM